jgi:hypothetical protein
MIIPLLLADIAEWIVPVLVVTFFVISHLWNAIKGTQQQAPQRRPQTERPLKPQPADGRGQPTQPVAQQASGQGQLNAEIDQFLKRANERRGEKGGEKSRRPQQSNRQAPAKAPLPSEKAAANQPRPTAGQRRGFDSVAESVQQHLGDRTFEQREQGLADDVVRAEEQLSQHVEQSFNNRLGTLGPGETSTPKPTETAAVVSTDDRAAAARAVAGLLINQQSLRQAVLLKEILERPVDRW